MENTPPLVYTQVPSVMELEEGESVEELVNAGVETIWARGGDFKRDKPQKDIAIIHKEE